MLKQLFAGLALVFLGLLPSVRGDEGYSESRLPYDSLSNLISGFKEYCPKYQDSFFCFYRDSARPSGLQSPNSLKSISTEEGVEMSGRGTRESIIQFPESYKRFLVGRSKNPTVRGYKRGPGFRSWGGKRDLKPFWEKLDKRTEFRPWGGKREGEYFSDDFLTSGSEEWNEKRARFQNWGGKKSTNDFPESPNLFDAAAAKRGSIWKDRSFYLNEPFKKNVPKRPQFQSWGGKRTPYLWQKIFGFSNSESQTYPVNGGEKRKFSSWGGKRYENNGNDVIRQDWEDQRSTSDINSSKEGIFGPPKPILEDNATQMSKITGTKTWQNDEPPSNAWEQKEREQNNTR